MVDFLVVDCHSTYNAIIGRTALSQFKAVTSIYHLRLKFPTEQGIGEVKGDQLTARECYLVLLKGEVDKEAMVVEELEVRDEEEVRRGEPVEDLEQVVIRECDQSRVIRIGTSALDQLNEELRAFLRQNADFFAWTYENMSGIDTQVAAHCLNIIEGAKPVKQKRRSFAPKCNEAIAEKVDKLLDSKFIQESQYPTWLSNVVMIKERKREMEDVCRLYKPQ